MRAENSIATVISDGDIIFYHTGFYVDDGFLIILNGVNHLLTDGRYIESAHKKANAKCYLLKDYPLIDFLKNNGAKSVGIIFNFTSASLYSKLISNGFKVFDCESEFNKIQAIKSVNQIQAIKTACSITEKAFYQTLPFIKKGVTELEVAGELEHNYKKLGGKVGFETIVAFGEGGSVPHYETSSKKLDYGMPILMDFGCSYQGFLSDMTRTMFFGEPTKKFLVAYEAVKNAHLVAVNNARAGMTAGEVDLFARGYLKEFGLSEYFTHSLGHGVGVKIHEYPTIKPSSETVIENGMVFTIEPGVYFEGEFGIRIEDTVTVQDGKIISLMQSDKELITIR